MPVLEITIADERFRAEGDRIVIGRSSSCDIKVEDDIVSRQHLALRWEKGGWLLEDLEPKNGSFIAQERVKGDRALAAGVGVQLGKGGPMMTIEAPVPDPGASTESWDALVTVPGGGVPTPMEMKAPKLKPGHVFGALVFLLVLAGAAYLLWEPITKIF